jgi:hypothetical protein
MFGGDAFGSQAFGAAIEDEIPAAIDTPGIPIASLCSGLLTGQSIDDLCD